MTQKTTTPKKTVRKTSGNAVRKSAQRPTNRAINASKKATNASAQKRKNNVKRVPKKNNQKRNKLFDVYVGISLTGVLFGVFMIVFFFPGQMITFSKVTLIILTAGIVLNLAILPLGLRKNKKGKTLISEIGSAFYILLNFFGGGVFLTGLILMLNFAGRSVETHSEHYKFGERDPNYRVSHYSGVVYILENNKHPEETNLRWFELKNTRAIMEKGHLEIRFSSGLFGIDIFPLFLSN